MARLSAPFALTGSFGSLVAYRRKDLPYTLVRSASSLSRERFRTDPSFENARRTASEAGGRSRAAQALRRVLHPLSPVRDGNWQGTLTGALTAVQHRDTDSVYGQRNILLSQHGALLAGFCLSRRTPFESLLRAPLNTVLDKTTGKAAVNNPELITRLNFFPTALYPYFRTVAVLGAVPDHFYTAHGYTTGGDYTPHAPAAAYADWHPVKGGAPATTIELTLPPPPGNAFALVLAVGIVMGTVNKEGTIEPVGYAGSGKILEVR